MSAIATRAPSATWRAAKARPMPRGAGDQRGIAIKSFQMIACPHSKRCASLRSCCHGACAGCAGRARVSRRAIHPGQDVDHGSRRGPAKPSRLRPPPVSAFVARRADSPRVLRRSGTGLGQIRGAKGCRPPVSPAASPTAVVVRTRLAVGGARRADAEPRCDLARSSQGDRRRRAADRPYGARPHGANVGAMRAVSCRRRSPRAPPP